MPPWSNYFMKEKFQLHLQVLEDEKHTMVWQTQFWAPSIHHKSGHIRGVFKKKFLTTTQQDTHSPQQLIKIAKGWGSHGYNSDEICGFWKVGQLATNMEKDTGH